MPCPALLSASARCSRENDKSHTRHQRQDTATRVTKPAVLRVAVTAFDTWAEAKKAGLELCSGPNPLCRISYLALEGVLPDGHTQPLSKLPFPGNAAPIVCSAGAIAERLSTRLEAGTASLQTALMAWLKNCALGAALRRGRRAACLSHTAG
jgi:hypothetical protein